MNNKSLRLFATAIFLAGSSLLRAANIPPAENLLPADTLAFFTIPDVAALRTASKTSPPMMFWNDPAMKPFHDKFMAKLNEKLIAPLETNLGLKLANFLPLLQGQFTLAVTVNGSNGHDDVPPGIILLLDAKGQSSQLKTNLDALTKKWTAAGRPLHTEEIRGLKFTVLPLSSNDMAAIFPHRTPVSEIGQTAKPTQSGDIYFTQYQSLLIAGNSAKALAVVAAHLTGGGDPALADNAGFAADKLSQFRDAPAYYGWFNTAKLFRTLMSAGDDTDALSSTPFTAAKILGATGLGGLKSASFVVREQPTGSFFTLHLTAPAAARSGLMKMIALPHKDASIPNFVPADAVKFTRIRLDGAQAWTELQKMVGGISSQYLSSLNSVIDVANTMAQAKNPAFDLRSYLFNNLGDDLIIYQEPPIGDTIADLASAPTLYLVAVSDVDKAIVAVKTLAGMVAPQDGTTPRDFLGHKIYTIALRATQLPGAAAPQPNSLFVSSSGGYLAISKTVGSLEEYLRNIGGNGQPLNGQPGLADAASRVGGTSGGLFTYENQREGMRIAFKLLKNSTADALGTVLIPPAFRDWADFSLLPDYAPLAKYFYFSVCAASTDADGVTLKTFAPRPPQLN